MRAQAAPQGGPGPQAALLPDGRLHLHHGPIDLIIGVFGPGDIAAAHARAMARFDGLLEGLVAELPALRSATPHPLRGPVARAMAAAVAPFRPAFITPMAAVAGAVADAVLAVLPGPGITRAYVNNGGDIALLLAEGQALTAAIAARPGLPDRVTIAHADPVRGIATSGWRGRSFSLGIADAVTVLAPNAATADAAATMIANAVDLPGHPAIARRPARDMDADSDLGQRLVTIAVAPLGPTDCAAALDAGAAFADTLCQRGLINGAALFLQGATRTIGQPLLAPNPEQPRA
ncbi:UPF0280 family protein [Fertoebacter nigrum]|uniref:UPF0280 family protein n=2 Tax=Fertoeibacter niger TaxID=2656921 RepID=A0A8X8H3L0_9RHOB|nr:UPF0280 family protein [Fertoeibacter niger]